MDGITLTSDLSDIKPHQLEGFFVGWPKPPSTEAHLKMLTNSSFALLAVEESTKRIAGFLSALTDGVLFGYISAVEVLPEFQGRGIGKALVEHTLTHFQDLYAIDLVCDPDVQPFYEKCGLIPYQSMIARRRDRI